MEHTNILFHEKIRTLPFDHPLKPIAIQAAVNKAFELDREKEKQNAIDVHAFCAEHFTRK